MNVLILGNNEINSVLQKSIKEEGLLTSTILEPDEIVSFTGDPGAFKIKTPKGTFLASSVIITEPQNVEAVTVGETKTLNLMDVTQENLNSIDHNNKIVFLLDYTSESPEYLTARAMKLAKKLSERKKCVYFLSKFVRTLSNNMESAYREARNSGITFIKYNDCDLIFSEETNNFTIKVSDGVIETVITTPYVVSAGNTDGEKLKKISKKLRLTQYSDGLINDDKFFLYPVLTSRRGIFYFNPSVSYTKIEEGLRCTVPAIVENIELFLQDFVKGDENITHATVDPRKCAFCYTCYRACPHAAMEPDLVNSAMINVTISCEACGICVSVCPAEAITIDDEYGLTADTVKPGKSNKCKIFCCENSAEIAYKQISGSLGELASKIDVESIPCGGRLSLETVTAALTTYGKVLVAVCMDDACRHFKGGKRACKQIERTEDMLKKAGINERLVKCVKVSHVMENILRENIQEFLQD